MKLARSIGEGGTCTPLQRSDLMPARPSAQSVDVTLPLLGYLAAYSGLATAFFFLLFWLMQPRMIPNPGMAAHFAPAATRLEPLPRKRDAPALVEVPELSRPVAFAQEDLNKVREERPNKDVRAPVRKRSRTVVRREYQEPAHGYAQQWNGSPWGGRWF